MTYACPPCGYRSPKWMGFCPQCKSQDPLTEVPLPTKRHLRLVAAAPVGRGSPPDRLVSGIGELDRVLGGGLVVGGVVLLGGEPGVGKSTLLLQAAAGLAAHGHRTLIVAAEESAHQVGLRASRLGIASPDVLVVAATEVDAILDAAAEQRPQVVVVDSLQSVHGEGGGGSPSGVTQVRESAARLVRCAKEQGVTVIMVGHITKEGAIAGPKVVEHMVDVVLTFEGDPQRGLRVLRGLKNRYGATQVVGVFEMSGEGLRPVVDPSSTFLAAWAREVPGTVAYPALIGGRSVLVEVQALAVKTSQHQPRRSFRGIETARAHQVLAVLARHARLPLQEYEVYLNVIGGWMVEEPAVDLAALLAVASSVFGIPLGSCAAWGEVGLAGEVRPTSSYSLRMEEAARMGITRLVAPEPGRGFLISEAMVHAGLLGGSST